MGNTWSCRYRYGVYLTYWSNIYSQLIVSFGTNEVYNTGTLYPYKVYITNELSYPKSVKESFLGSTGYYPLKDRNSLLDTGFQQQCQRFATSKIVHLQSRLDFDLTNQELYLLNQIDVLLLFIALEMHLSCISLGRQMLHVIAFIWTT